MNRPKLWIDGLMGPNPQVRSDRRLAALLFVLTVVLYVPGMCWGLPEANAPEKTNSWAADELGPLGPIKELYNTFVTKEQGNPIYPFFHYAVLAVFYAPYLLFQFLTGGLAHPQAAFPFGLADPSRSIKTLLLIARGVSVLMGAGTVVLACFTARTLWDRTAGVLAAGFVMLMYPMFFYARTSNVDVPALFWCSVVMYLFIVSMKERSLTVRRWIWLGIFAALAVATKDMYYGFLIVLPLPLLAMYFRRMFDRGALDAWSLCKAPLIGLAASVFTYGVASGLALSPGKYFGHVATLRAGSPRYWFEYPATLAGYLGLARECFGHLADILGEPLLGASLAGILICWRTGLLPLTLLLCAPSFFVAVLMPVGYVEMRYLIVIGYVLALFAARAVGFGLQSSRRALRIAAAAVLVVGAGLTLLHGADLTYIMLRDSRHDAAAWLNRQAKDGDRVEHFRPIRRPSFLPRLRPGLTWFRSSVTPSPSRERPQGDFLVTMGRPDMELHWGCPEWVYRRLLDGSFGYVLAADFQTPSLFSIHYRHIGVNERIQIFVPRERLPVRAGSAASEAPVHR